LLHDNSNQLAEISIIFIEIQNSLISDYLIQEYRLNLKIIFRQIMKCSKLWNILYFI